MVSAYRRLWFIAVAAAMIGSGADCRPRSPAAVDPPPTTARGSAQEHIMVTDLLDQVAAMSVDDYDPTKVIRAVNALQPLGKDHALDQIAFWLRGHPNAQPQGLFWVLRTLFDMPAGQGFPPVRIGQPNVPPPVDPGSLPRFPIMIVRDTPLLVVTGYDLAGMPETVDVHVAYFRAHGTVRDRPLAPGPLAGLEQDVAQQWSTACGKDHLDEVLRAVRPQIQRLGAR
jgi:hypothetical protein